MLNLFLAACIGLIFGGLHHDPFFGTIVYFLSLIILKIDDIQENLK